MPALAVGALRASGEVTSLVPLIVVAVVLSVGASYLGAVVWATTKGSKDVLFADLMLWGWARRWRAERQLASAVKLLGLQGASDSLDQLSSNRRVRLFERLAGGLEARYPDTQGHSRRVARHAAAIAKRMGLPSEEVARIRTAAAVHDVGKIETPAEIMNKPRRLTDEEFAVIKLHPAAGARMVAGLGDDELTRIVRHHHERLDGGGYPDGLSGSQIPVGARIIAVADTFDAITSTRPYRPAKRHREALEILAAEAGTQLDPAAVRAFRSYYSGLRPVALWALFVNGTRQLIASLAGGTKLAGAVTATTLATVAVGNIAITAPKADHRSSESDAVATRFAADPRGGDGAGSKGDDIRPQSSGKGPVGGTHGGGAPEPGDPSGAEEGSNGPSSTDQPGSPSNGGGSGGGSSDGGGGSDGERGSNVPRSPGQVVSDVTAPVDTVVDTVAGTIDSVPVRVPTPDDVQSVLPRAVPRLPLPGLGGK